MDTTFPSTKRIRPALASIPASCEYLGGISHAQFYKIMDGLETVKIGSRRMVVMESLDRFIEATRNKPDTG